ncbi:MAG: hypothetical protein HC853_17220 [Anaerolineae bacterium]|nr:hypothetical protein [Anaerolineae bacterium]
MPYIDLIQQRVRLEDVVATGTIVRLESTGEDWDVERALLTLGAQQFDDEAAEYEYLTAEQVDLISFDRGRIWPQRQWYLGYLALLAQIKQQLAHCPPHRLMNHPDDIAIMFDKRRTHAALSQQHISVPRALPIVNSYSELLTVMKETGIRRVFVKLAHGSSASGVLAYQMGGANNDKHKATTTVEMVHTKGQAQLYNSLRVRAYHAQRDIAGIIDALCRHRVHVEEWVPKAGIAGRTFDLRVLVIGGSAKHTVVRMSRGPMTNLHLANVRGDAEAVRARMGEHHWQAAQRTCERAAACFKNSLYIGIDLLIGTDFRQHAVLEANAFGDLLPRLLYEGKDTYEEEIGSLMHGAPA